MLLLCENRNENTLRHMLKVSITSVMPIQTEAHTPYDFDCNFQKKKVSDNYGAWFIVDKEKCGTLRQNSLV